MKPQLRRYLFTFGFAFLITTATTTAQDKVSLPDDLNSLIEMKTGLLEQYSELQKTGPPDKAIAILRTIVDIHRKAYQVAKANKENDDLLSKLRNVYANDAEFLSDQLLDRREYGDAAKLRRDVVDVYREVLGEEAQATRLKQWRVVTAEKLGAASNEAQVNWSVAIGSKPQAVQALQNGQLDVAARLYVSIIEAETAVLTDAHPDVAVDLNEYGRVLASQQKYAAAEVVYQRSLKGREASIGKDLPYATTSFNLARLYQDTKRYAEAEKLYQQAAAIEEPILGSTNPSFLQTLQQLEILYGLSGESDKQAAIRQRIAAADPLATVVSHLPSGTFAAAAVRPAVLAGDPGLQMLPLEVAEAAGRQQLGFNPMEVDAAVALLTLPIAGNGPNYGFAFKLKAGVQADYPWAQNSEVVEFGQGKTYYRESSGGPNAMCSVEFEDGTVLFGAEETIRQSLTQSGNSQVGQMLLADRDRGHVFAAANMELIRPFVVGALQEAPTAPPQLEALKNLPNAVKTMQLWVNLTQGLKLSLVLNTASEESASATAESISQALAFGQEMTAQEIRANFDGNDPVQQAMADYAQRIAGSYMQRLQPAVSGSAVAIETDVVDSSILGPAMVALLLPAVNAAREAAQRTSDGNNLRMIGLALHSFHDTHNRLPARASYDETGRALLSWRVHLLPYLNEKDLYDQFHLDEPWDSEHNLKLSEQMPNVFRSKVFPDESRTVYVTLDGTGTAMEGREGLSFRDFTDGLSNTIAVVEADPENAVIWTKPVDLPFDPATPGRGLGAIRPQGFQALLCDGAMRRVPADISPETLRRLILRNDGQPVEEF
ncbi:MAG: DUF1559 domain-containing protein [Planctomycetaceae bacterium]